MDNPVTLVSAFLLGLFSTIHCIGMCGGIIGALSLGLPNEIKNHKLQLFLFISSFNVGRILSYTLAGFIAGAAGMGLFSSAGLEQGHALLRYIAATVMIAIGLYLAGWLPQLAIIEKIGIPLWQKLEPISRKLLPVSTLPKALVYGLIWGWLPCGLVYFVLISAITTGEATQGALTLLAFGLGTLPTLITAGLFTSRLAVLARNPVARNLTGGLIIAMAIASLFIPMQHHH
jgi:hypothetical protein